MGMRGLSAAPGNVFKHSDDGGLNWTTDSPSVNYQVSAATQRMVYSTKAKLILHATQANPPGNVNLSADGIEWTTHVGVLPNSMTCLIGRRKE